MQSLSIEKYRIDIQLLNKYFCIIFSQISFFLKLALSIRCANFAASPLITKKLSHKTILMSSYNWRLENLYSSHKIVSLRQRNIFYSSNKMISLSTIYCFGVLQKFCRSNKTIWIGKKTAQLLQQNHFSIQNIFSMG